MLYNDNFLRVIKNYDDNCIDLIITDPPYKMSHATGGCTNMGIKNKWQGNIKAGNTIVDFDLSINFSDWLPEAYRVLKPGGHCYIFCNDKNIQELLNAATQVGFKESNVLVWIKNNSTPNRWYMKNVEYILFLHKGKAIPINNLGSKAGIYCQNIHGKDKLHPTQKPVELLEKFITNSSQENAIVLDPFMGSGSTGVACCNTNRKFIGVEINNKYYEIAKNRIESTGLYK